MSKDCYSKYSLSKGPKIMIPDHNYSMGERKSEMFEGAGWYVPSERRWVPYHEYKHLPIAARRDAIEFAREEDYVKFVNDRDRFRAPMLTSYVPCGVPEVKLNGHRRLDHNLPAHSQFMPSARFPQWDGPGYYGYYHEALDKHSSGEFRTLPALSRYPGYPLVSKTTGI